MKSHITYFTLFIALSLPVYAESSSGRTPMSGSQAGTSQTMHTMTREMTHDMVRMMQQMNTMTQEMSQLMEKDIQMDQTRTREMARIMEQLSTAMHKMSQHMEKGELNKNMLQEMERHMNRIRTMIKTMQQNK